MRPVNTPARMCGHYPMATKKQRATKMSKENEKAQPVNRSKIIMVSDPDTQVISKPDDISWKDAADYCVKKENEGKTPTASTRTWVAFPWVLGVAVEHVLRAWSSTEADVKRLNVPMNNGRLREVVWGTFEIAGLGTLAMGAGYNQQLRRPEVSVRINHETRHKTRALELIAAIDEQMSRSEWMRGLALQLAVDSNGNVDMFATPQAVSVPDMTEDEVVLPTHLSAEIAAGILFPLRRPDECRKAGVSVRRGALLAGRPGTGKTMTARLATRVAIDSGWGVLYIPDSRALEQTLAIAAALAPCLVVCEDIDRQLGKERDASTDRILNALDGLDRSKPVMLICTSNAAETLPPALLRAGRLDLILIFETPDDHAARVLLRRYLGEYAPSMIREHGCSGLLPASIKEVAQRAKLHALRLGDPFVSEDAILACARAVRAQQVLLEKAEAPKVMPTPKLDVTLRNGQQEATPAENISAASRALEGARGAPALPGVGSAPAG